MKAWSKPTLITTRTAAAQTLERHVLGCLLWWSYHAVGMEFHAISGFPSFGRYMAEGQRGNRR